MTFEFEELSSSQLIQGAVYKGGNNKNPMKDDPLSKIFKMEGFQKGIGNQGGFRKTSKEQNNKVKKGTIAFVVMVDSKKQSEWPNEFNEITGTFTYYGDNRTVGNDIFKTKNLGNEFLYDIFKKSYANLEEKASIPPIFLFSSTGNGSDKNFIGIAVPDINGNSLESSLERKTFDTQEASFENFIAHFTILNTSQEEISREWLRDLKLTESSISNNAPKAWMDFILNDSINDNKIKAEELELTQEIYKYKENEVTRNIKVRVTQGEFRDNLLKRDKACLLCGLDIDNLLVASHIKPWSKSSNNEKVDSNNGLLLCSMHDALFDKGYISFDDTGKLIISKTVDRKNYKKLNISNDLSLSLINNKQKHYLKHHRENIFKSQ